MSEENQSNQEIDLIELMGRFLNWCGRLLKSVFYGVLYFIIRNRYLYAVAFLVVIALTIYKSVFSEKYYNCDMIVQTRAVGSADVVGLVNNWNYMQQLPDDLIKVVRTINATYLLDYNKDGIRDAIEKYTGRAANDSVQIKRRLNNEFCIQVQVYNADNTDILNEIRDSVIAYISNDSWVLNRNDIRQAEISAMIARINNEMNVLDSLKNYEYFVENEKYKIDKNGGLMMVSEKDKHLYHGELISLLSRKQNLERNFYPEPFKIIQDFSTPREAVNSLFNNFKTSFLFVLVVATVIILIIDKRNDLKNLVEESKR